MLDVKYNRDLLIKFFSSSVFLMFSAVYLTIPHLKDYKKK